MGYLFIFGKYLLIYLYAAVFLSLFTELDDLNRKRKLRRPPKAEGLKPSSPKELPRMVNILETMLKLNSKEVSILFEIISHMKVLFQKSGVKFTIGYYSEVLRLIFEYLSGRGMRQTKTWVKVTKSGLPIIIGKKARDYLTQNRDKIISNSPILSTQREFVFLRAVISTVALFRTMSPKHVIKFDSVTAPYTGTGTLSDDQILRALRSLGITALKPKSPYFFWSNKAGVNASYAFISIGLDFLALLGHPKVFLNYIVYSYKMGYYLFLIVIFTMTCLCLPIFLLSYPIHGCFALGRLSIVKELRGKARVVGITDYWTQILFKPLHDSIYHHLSQVTNDGTYEQLRPITDLLLQKPDHIVSVDLTAATDRLPVELQGRILNCLGIPGTEWRNILVRDYFYQDTAYRYTVGQPMGAYSSFGMLALTNHTLMHAALLTLPKEDRTLVDYAILGDDVAIKGQALADPYIANLTMLGVEVNPLKGFSGSILEFAKNIFTIGGTNLSPVGAKTLLQSSRKPIYFPSLIVDLSKKDYFLFLKPELLMFTNYLSSLYDFKSDKLRMVKWLFCFLGPQSGLWAWPKGYVSSMEHQVLFEAFLTLFVGANVSRVDIQTWFEKTVLRKSLYSFSAIVSAGESALRVFKYSRKPYIWSSEKFGNLLRQTPGNTATLAMASSSFVLVPVLFWYWISATFVGISLFLLSKLMGTAKADPRELETIKHWREVSRMYWDLLHNIEYVPTGPWYRPDKNYILFGQPILDGLAKLNGFIFFKGSNIHKSVQTFSNWLSNVKSDKPTQILSTRFEKVKPWELEGDSLPAIRTAEKCLSSFSPTLAKYYSDNRMNLKRNYLKSNKKSTGNKRGRAVKRPQL
nr:MAG: RNA-dependent RNA polymerase [Mitovirus sp.]